MKRLNERKEPFELHQLTLLRQRYANFASLEEEYARLTKGHEGEVNVDYHLSFLPHTYSHLCQIRLHIDDYYAQFDSLLFSPTTLYICETKSLTQTVVVHHERGTMTFGHQELASPLLQAEQQAVRLRSFAETHQLQVPIEPLVIFSEKTTTIQQVGGHSQRLLYARGVAKRIERLEEEAGRRPYDFAKLWRLLTKHHTPTRWDMVERYGVRRDLIEGGMRCEKCRQRNFVRAGGKWHCLNCGDVSATAHLAALRAYAYLFGVEITKAEAWKWLGCGSERTIFTLLQSFPQVKKNRYTYYDLSQLM